MKNQLVSYILSGTPIVSVTSSEEQRIEGLIIESAGPKRAVQIWSHTQGFLTYRDGETVAVSRKGGRSNNNDSEEASSGKITDPYAALESIFNEPPPASRSIIGLVYIFRDIHPFLTAPRVARILRDIAREFKKQSKTLFIVSPVNKVPPEIERDVVIADFDLPSNKEITELLNSIIESSPEVAGDIPSQDKEKIVSAAMGLTLNEAEGAIAKALTDKAKKFTDLPIDQIVLAEKAQVVKRSGLMEYHHNHVTANDIGGLDQLKSWLTKRSKAYSKTAREFGLRPPKGILLVGPPGTGKSLCAKATSSVLGVPLIRFDIGRVFGGIVGASEANMRQAIKTVESIDKVVLWIDEMDKAFAGMLDGRTGDSGTSQRVFGNFITWMQETDRQVFIVATVNRISGLPPELLRKGRFDEIFYVSLPCSKDRETILKIHIAKNKRDPSKFALSDCVANSDGFSGAELEAAVNEAMYEAFDNGTELNDKLILAAIKKTNPLSRSNSQEIQRMTEWAELNAVCASNKENPLANLAEQFTAKSRILKEE